MLILPACRPATEAPVEAEAPPAAETEPAATAMDTFIFGRGADSIQLDPVLVTDGKSFRVTGQVFNSLHAFEQGAPDPVPSLAEKCTRNADSSVWDCKLRGGVKFHDGTDFNADAVAFNLERWRSLDNPYHVPSEVFECEESTWGGFDDSSLDAGLLVTNDPFAVAHLDQEGALHLPEGPGCGVKLVNKNLTY